jgi:hypothetical protein
MSQITPTRFDTALAVVIFAAVLVLAAFSVVG